MDYIQEINNLKEEIKKLKSAATIPYETEQALRERLRLASFMSIYGSSKSATSENQSVNESGSSSYSVLKPPDIFLQVTVSGVLYYIPVFT